MVIIFIIVKQYMETQENAIRFVSDLTTAVESWMLALLILPDINDAFDTVDHNIDVRFRNCDAPFDKHFHVFLVQWHFKL